MRQLNIEMDAASRLPSLLHILPFLGFIPSMYMIGMIIYYILEYFDVQRFSALFLFMLTSFPLSVAWVCFNLKMILTFDTASHLPIPSSVALLLNLTMHLMMS